MTASGTPRPATSRPAAPRFGGALYVFAAAVVLTGAAIAWRTAAARRLDEAVVAVSAEQLGHARGVFDSMRARVVAGLAAQCRVLVEDPRIKASLATEGVDEATVRDILVDVLRLRRAGFLLVLSREARVFAEAGADELRGLDLSGSSVMGRARGASEAIGGAWVIGGKLIDLAVAPVRFDREVIAYLVVGQAVDPELVKAVDDATGTAVAVIAGPEPAPVSTGDAALAAVFQIVAAEPGPRAAHVVDRDGTAYVAASFELEGTPQTHPRLALVRAMAPQRARFASFAWLLWLPCALVLIGVVLGALGVRPREAQGER